MFAYPSRFHFSADYRFEIGPEMAVERLKTI
jgi:hypothetical protein